MGLVKNSYEFQYFPSSTCEKYDFSYGERFKLKHNFIYNPYPSRRRYWFFYEIRNPLILEDGESLLKLDGARGLNINKTLDLDILSRSIIQERQIELIVGDILKCGNYRKLNIENTKNLTGAIARKIRQQYGYIIHEKRANNIDINDDISMYYSGESSVSIEKGRILKSDLVQHISDIIIEEMSVLSGDSVKDTRHALIEGGEDVHYTKDSIKPTDFDLEGGLDMSRVIGQAIINKGLELKIEPSKREVNVEEQHNLVGAMKKELAARGVDIDDSELRAYSKTRDLSFDDNDYSLSILNEVSRELNLDIGLELLLDRVNYQIQTELDAESKLSRSARSFYVEEQELLHRDTANIFNDEVEDKLESHIGSAKEIRLSDDTIYRVVSDTLDKMEIPPVELLHVAKGEKRIFVEDSLSELEQSKDSDSLSSIKTQSEETLELQGVGSDKIRYDSGVELKDGVASKDISMDSAITTDKAAGQNDNVETSKDQLLNRSANNNKVALWGKDKVLEVDTDKVGTELYDSEEFLNKTKQSVSIEKDEAATHLDTVEREVTVEKEEIQATIHKRLWFIKQYDSIDYKILPNEDYSYPMGIDRMVHKPSGDYKFNYTGSYDDIEDLYGKDFVYEIELYDSNSKLLYRYYMPYIQEGQYAQGNIDIKYKVSEAAEGKPYDVNYEITISGSHVAYMIIRQPKDIDGVPVLYVATEKLLVETHPLPMGNDLGLKEIPIHIPIMVEFINVLLLFWSKFYFAFTGYTGSRAIFGLVNMVYEWLMLETSQEEAAESMEDYYRCYRWFRWEAEKTYHRAKQDPTLSGNYWIEEVLFEMIEYMETHHFNIMPEFEEMQLMDEYRDVFQDPSFDMEFTLDKMKGIRNRVIDKNKRLND